MLDELIVIVDDKRTFYSEVFDHAFYARNSPDAMALLGEIWVDQQVDYGVKISRLYLDHDLGYDLKREKLDDVELVVNFIDCLAKTGTPLLIDEICIHSMNPTAERFIMTLKKNYAVSRIQLPALKE